jgi:hypothetical protein
VRNVVRTLQRGWPDMVEVARMLPPLAQRTLEQWQDDRLEVPVDMSALERLRNEVVAHIHSGDRVLIGAVFGIAAVLWLALRGQPRVVGYALAVAAFLSWLAAWARRRRGHRTHRWS